MCKSKPSLMRSPHFANGCFGFFLSIGSQPRNASMPPYLALEPPLLCSESQRCRVGIQFPPLPVLSSSLLLWWSGPFSAFGHLPLVSIWIRAICLLLEHLHFM